MNKLAGFVALLAMIGAGLLAFHKPAQRSGPGTAITPVSVRATGGPTGAALVVPTPPERPQPTDGVSRGVVNVYGTADVISVINDVRNNFEKREGSPRVETKPMSIDDAKSKIESSSTFDFALINREQTDDEKHLKANPVAYRGLCLVVNVNNPVTSLSDTQIADIYQGKNTKWTEAGGSDAPIGVYQFSGKANPVAAFYDYLKITADKVVPAVGQSDDAAEVVRKVGLDAGGIAFVPYMVVSSQQDRDNSKVKLVAINNVDPSAATIRDGTYPLGLPIILLTRGEPEDGPARDFLRYVNSDDVQGKNGVLRQSLLLSGR